MLKTPLKNLGGELYIEDVSAVKLAEAIGTPLYVMSESKIRENYRKLKEAFSSKLHTFKILYSAKANTNISVLKILRSEGAYVDTVSMGEVYSAPKAGFKPWEILYTGVNAGDEGLKYVLDNKVMVNIDSISQLKRLLRVGVPETLSVRINTEIGAGHHEYVITVGKQTTFGLDGEAALEPIKSAKRLESKNSGYICT